MSVQSALKRIRYAAAPANLFTDASSGFVYPYIDGVDLSLGVKRYARDFLVADHDHFAGFLGEKETGIKLTMELRGFGGSPAGAGNSVIAGDGENGLLLKTAWGNQVKDTGNTCASGSTPTVVNATSGTLLSVGNIIGLVDPGSGLLHLRQIRSKASNALTIDRALPFTPAAAAVIYASASYSHAIQGHQHLWFDVEGYDPTAASNWRRYVRGCLLDFAMKLEGRSTIEFNGKGVDWSTADGTTQGTPTFPANLPLTGASATRLARLWLGATQTKVTDFAFELGNDVQAKPNTDAANGVAGFFLKGAKKTGKFSVLHDDGGAAIVAAFLAGTKQDLLIEIPSGGVGNAFALSAPSVELTAYKPKSVNGLDAYEFDFQVLRNDTITGVPDVTFGVV